MDHRATMLPLFHLFFLQFIDQYLTVSDILHRACGKSLQHHLILRHAIVT